MRKVFIDTCVLLDYFEEREKEIKKQGEFTKKLTDFF